MKKACLFVVSILAWGVLQAQTETILIAEPFEGGPVELNGTAADLFDAALIAKGGVGTWQSRPDFFLADGSILNPYSGNAAAYLTLGSYINDSKGSADAKFRLTATLDKPTGSNWTSLGFFVNPTGTSGSFIDNPPRGLATIIYRVVGGLQPFSGPGNSNSGTQTTAYTLPEVVTIELDFTPFGGYDGINNHGTVRYFRGTSPEVSMGSFIYTSSHDFLGIGMTKSGSAGGVSSLTLKQFFAEAAGPLMEVSHDLEPIALGATNGLGNVVANGTLSRVFTIANNPAASADLELTGNPAVVFAENGTTSYGGFTITTNVPGSATTLEPGALTTFAVRFDATQGPGRHYATPSIANTHQERNPFVFSVHAGTYAIAVLPVLVSDNFSGGHEDLNSSCVESFGASLLDAAGNPTWWAKQSTFRANGQIINGSMKSATLSLGSYVESVMGTPAGKFWLSAMLDRPTGGSGAWVSLGFFSSNTPIVDGYFASGSGRATILYRNSGVVNAYGVGALSGITGSTLTGTQRFTVELDLTPEGGYDGETNFGTAVFYEGTPDPANSIGSYTFTEASTFGSFGLSLAAAETHGKASALSLMTLPSPPAAGTMLFFR